MIEKYSEFKIGKNRNIIRFLDEVTSLNEWWKAIKVLIDSDEELNDAITVTGSSSRKIKGNIELFLGRTRKVK